VKRRSKPAGVAWFACWREKYLEMPQSLSFLSSFPSGQAGCAVFWRVRCASTIEAHDAHLGERELFTRFLAFAMLQKALHEKTHSASAGIVAY